MLQQLEEITVNCKETVSSPSIIMENPENIKEVKQSISPVKKKTKENTSKKTTTEPTSWDDWDAPSPKAK